MIRDLKRISAVLQEISQAKKLRVYTHTRSLQKLGWLKNRGRDFLKPTQHVQNRLTYTMREVLRNRDITYQMINSIISSTLREIVIARFDYQGLDIRLRPLTRRYFLWKQRKGYSTKIGILTGNLYRALSSARYVLEK